MKKYIVLLFALMSMLIAGGCSSEPKKVEAAPELVSGVHVANVERAVIPDVVEAMGAVRAAQTTQVAAQVMGNIVALNVREGDRVQRGQVLAAIDDTQARAAAERAQAAVLAAEKDVLAAQSDATLAASTLKRYENLWQKNSVSAQEFDEVKARAQAAEARLELARAGRQQAQAALTQANTQLGYARVHAPFDGVVTEKKVDLGTVAVPGMPLLTIEDTRRYQLEVTVDESQAAVVKLGGTTPVVVDAVAGQIQAKVAQIVPASDPGSHSFVVKLDLPGSPQLRSGLFGRARFPKGTREALLIPGGAVVDRGQLHNVYVVGSDGVAALRYITVAPADDNRLEVLSGLAAGERVVADAGSRDLAGKVIR
jgi:RND family efflux transporter MFP subunit